MSNTMVVESDPRSRESIIRLLRDDGHSVADFPEATAALEALERSGLPFDLAVVAWDVAGPISGSEFLARLMQRNVTFPRIVVNALADLETWSRARAWGAADLLAKPIVDDRFRNAVRKALKEPVETDPLVAELRERVIGHSPALLEAVTRLAKVIPQEEVIVLLVGETGVGKGVFAKLIHEKSRPAGTPFIHLNLTTVPVSLFESELFGHVKGAFTGADDDKAGVFERAAAGTLFLDEVGHLARPMQPKLHHVIQDRKFARVGGNQELDFRARLVCASARNLAQSAQAGTFLDELYYRIAQFEIRIPPLRDRKEDLPALAKHILAGTGLRVERETMEIFRSYSWPGNVRELESVLTHAQTVCQGEAILPADLPADIMGERQSPKPAADPQPSWPDALFHKPYKEATADVENEFLRQYLPRRLKEAGDNKEKAAKLMGITPRALRDILRRCGLGHLVGRDEGETP